MADPERLCSKRTPERPCTQAVTQRGITVVVSSLVHSLRVPVAFQGAFILAALVVAPLAALAASSPEAASAQTCPARLRIDFAGLPAGAIIGEQYASSGVHISADANGEFPNKLIVFDSNAPPTHDPDLAADIGNIAILANNLDDRDANGLVDDPDENNYGGRAIFAFDQDVSVGSFLFVDKDHGSADFAIAYNAGGEVLARVPIPRAADGSVQRIDVNADGVRRFELDYRDSGGFTGIEVTCQTQPSHVVAAVAPTPTLAPAPVVAVNPPTPAVLSAVDLPAGGGPPRAGDSRLEWAAPLIVLTLALGCFIFYRRRRSR